MDSQGIVQYWDFVWWW